MLLKGTKKADLVAALSTLVAAKVAQPAAPDASGPADAGEESEFEDWSSGSDDSEEEHGDPMDMDEIDLQYLVVDDL